MIRVFGPAGSYGSAARASALEVRDGVFTAIDTDRRDVVARVLK